MDGSEIILASILKKLDKLTTHCDSLIIEQQYLLSQMNIGLKEMHERCEIIEVKLNKLNEGS